MKTKEGLNIEFKMHFVVFAAGIIDFGRSGDPSYRNPVTKRQYFVDSSAFCALNPHCGLAGDKARLIFAKHIQIHFFLNPWSDLGRVTRWERQKALQKRDY